MPWPSNRRARVGMVSTLRAQRARGGLPTRTNEGDAREWAALQSVTTHFKGPKSSFQPRLATTPDAEVVGANVARQKRLDSGIKNPAAKRGWHQVGMALERIGRVIGGLGVEIDL